MRNVFEWLGTKREKEILKHSGKHLEKVMETVNSLVEAMEYFVAQNEDKLRSSVSKVAQSEHEADLIRRELLMDLTAGEILPADRVDLSNFVTRLDSVADWAHTADRMLSLWTGKLPEQLKAPLLKFSRTAYESVERLKEVMDSIDTAAPKKILELCTDVESAEESADDQKRELMRLCLELNLDAGHLLVLHDLIEAVENISDAAEIVTDSIRMFAVQLDR